jgi:LacI family transcriptional regulator
MQDFIRNGIPFDGVFCATDLIAIGALKALDRAKIRIPQIVKVIGFDNISITENNYPSVSTVRQSVESFGSVAVAALMSIIDGKEPEQKHFILPVEVVRRETT